MAGSLSVRTRGTKTWLGDECGQLIEERLSVAARELRITLLIGVLGACKVPIDEIESQIPTDIVEEFRSALEEASGKATSGAPTTSSDARNSDGRKLSDRQQLILEILDEAEREHNASLDPQHIRMLLEDKGDRATTKGVRRTLQGMADRGLVSRSVDGRYRRAPAADVGEAGRVDAPAAEDGSAPIEKSEAGPGLSAFGIDTLDRLKPAESR